jgi:hypothetical protein
MGAVDSNKYIRVDLLRHYPQRDTVTPIYEHAFHLRISIEILISLNIGGHGGEDTVVVVCVRQCIAADAVIGGRRRV